MFFIPKLKRSVKVAIILVLLTIALGVQYINVSGSVAEAASGKKPGKGGNTADCICDDYNGGYW